MVILLGEDDVGRPNLAIAMFRSKDRHPNCNKVVVTLVIVGCYTLSVLLLAVGCVGVLVCTGIAVFYAKQHRRRVCYCIFTLASSELAHPSIVGSNQPGPSQFGGTISAAAHIST